MLIEASVATNDAAMRRISGRPFGLRRRSVCIVSPVQSSLLVTIVVTPCVQPAAARDAAREGCWDRLLIYTASRMACMAAHD